MAKMREPTAAASTHELAGDAGVNARRLAEQARTLRGVLQAGALILGALTVASGMLGLGVGEGLLVYGTGAVLHVGHLLALRTGRTRAVAISHCLTYLVWITCVLALRTGGLAAPAALVYPPIVLLGGLVWSGPAAIGLAVACSACGLALALLEQHGLLPQIHHPFTPLRLWLVLTGCVVITAIVLRYALNIILRSTGELFRNLSERLAAENDRRRLEGQLRQAQRLEALGRLAGGIAHDLNNLLTVVLGNIDLLRQGRGRRDDSLGEIQGAAQRAAGLTRQLLAVGRRQILNAVTIDVGEVVAALEPLFRRLIPEDVALRLFLDPEACTIAGDPAQLEQVALNLVTNAGDALPGGGTITMRVSRLGPEAHRQESGLPPDPVWLTVTDDGAGMSDEVKAHIFEPFFTTKEPGRGTGLGLATVHGIVSQSGGQIFVDSAPEAGTSFAIVFPRADGMADVAPQPAAGPPRPAASATILLVEDEPAVRGVASAMLASGGYRVLHAGNAAEALSVAEGFAGPIDLLLSDVVMQGGSGPRVARMLRRARPDLRVLYTSGHAEELIAQQGVLRAGVHFLPKPFTRSTLLDKVREVLASAEPGDLGLDTAEAAAAGPVG